MPTPIPATTTTTPPRTLSDAAPQQGWRVTPRLDPSRQTPPPEQPAEQPREQLAEPELRPEESIQLIYAVQVTVAFAGLLVALTLATVLLMVLGG